MRTIRRQRRHRLDVLAATGDLLLVEPGGVVLALRPGQTLIDPGLLLGQPGKPLAAVGALPADDGVGEAVQRQSRPLDGLGAVRISSAVEQLRRLPAADVDPGALVGFQFGADGALRRQRRVQLVDEAWCCSRFSDSSKIASARTSGSPASASTVWASMACKCSKSKV